MSYGLTTCRVGAFARLSHEASTALSECGAYPRLDDLLAQLADALSHHPKYERALQSFANSSTHGGWSRATRPSIHTSARISPEGGVASLPDRAFDWSDASNRARIRIFASVTACAVAPVHRNEPSNRITKLWWNFEILPVEPVNEVSSDLVSSIEGVAEAAFPDLLSAYNHVLIEKFPSLRGRPGPIELGSERVVVCLADTDSTEIASLLNRIIVSGQTVSGIRASADNEPKAGIDKLRAMANSVMKSGSDFVNDTDVIVNLQEPDVVGLLCKKQDGDAVRIAGFARRQGFGVHPSRLPQATVDLMRQERYRRATSSSRKLSARLADQQAAILDNAL